MSIPYLYSQISRVALGIHLACTAINEFAVTGETKWTSPISTPIQYYLFDGDLGLSIKFIDNVVACIHQSQVIVTRQK